jgi:DDE_Tnp_1-associated
VPAVSLSPINPALEQLQDLSGGGGGALLADECPSLRERLRRVPDPRDPRIRHTLTSLLLTAVAAALTRTRSFTAISEWVCDAPPQVLVTLEIRRDPLAGRLRAAG